MSDDTKDDVPVVLPAERDIASTGAAADSAEPDNKLKALPRLLRYAILSTKAEAFAIERLRSGRHWPSSLIILRC